MSTPLWKGAFLKPLFSLPFASALYSTAQDDGNALGWWVLTALLYPLHSMKVTVETSNPKNIIGTGYRGVIPFMLLNYIFCWQLTALYG